MKYLDDLLPYFKGNDLAMLRFDTSFLYIDDLSAILSQKDITIYFKNYLPVIGALSSHRISVKDFMLLPFKEIKLTFISHPSSYSALTDYYVGISLLGYLISFYFADKLLTKSNLHKKQWHLEADVTFLERRLTVTGPKPKIIPIEKPEILASGCSASGSFTSCIYFNTRIKKEILEIYL